MKEDSVYLNHILESIQNILEDTRGVSADEFLANRMMKQSVTRNIEIIGEAVKMVSEELRSKNKDIPWQKIARTRDMLIHHYFDVDDLELWKIVVDDLPKLKIEIEQLPK